MFYFFKIIFFLFAILPFGILYALSDMLYPAVYYIVRYRRKIVRKNITLAFPEKTVKEIIEIEKKFYRFFCDLFLEVIKFSTISEEAILKRIEFINSQAVSEILDSGQSVMLMTAHYGNWEWGSALPLEFGRNRVCTIYKELKNKNFMDLMNRIRSRFGTKNIEMKKLLREMLRLRNNSKPELFIMIADQRPKRSSIHLRLNFLSNSTAVFTGTEDLARKFDYPVVFGTLNRTKRGFYKAEFIRITEQPLMMNEFEMTEKYFSLLEQRIRKHPEFWLWTHDRWRF
jgi:KDO2-lipid IV(A) lauroyltransferase